MEITWAGHSTFILKQDNFSILTDPWFGENIFFRRIQKPGVMPEDIKPCQVVLVSHKHIDHFDKYGRELAFKWGAMVVAPPSLAKGLAKKGFNVKAAEPGMRITVSGLEIDVLPAHHPAPGARDAVGYAFKMDGRKIYFAGDTILSGMVMDSLVKVSPDIMLIPVGAFKLLGKKVVMDTRDAVEMAKGIKPGMVIPMHYGLLRGTKAETGLLKELASNDIAVNMLEPGVAVTI